MLKSLVLLICAGVTTAPYVYSQASPTASRVADLQAGGTFNFASPDYTQKTFKGFGFYSTLDFRNHLGIEAEFHQVNDPTSSEGIYERTYEIGPRYVMHFGRFSPYARVMVGRGLFSFPPAPSNPTGGAEANLAYNMWAGGFGTDYRLRRSINLRADYEFQQWGSFPPHGLTPRVLSIGIAYHFH